VLRAQATGHAMLARLFAAEQPDAARDAAPVLVALRWPTVAPGRLRVDSDLAPGASPRLDRDGSLAKLVAFGPTRHQALLTLDRVLAEAVLEPPMADLQRLRAILADEAFRAGQYDESCAERVLAELRLPQ
jgi:acetyl/propionyl-CoA carboxylase alpha subunit